MQYLTPFPGFSKTQILGRREEELRHAIKHAAPSVKIAKAAERIRVAKLHLIKALQHALEERQLAEPLATDEIAKFQRKADSWRSIPTDEIIKLFTNDDRLSK